MGSGLGGCEVGSGGIVDVGVGFGLWKAVIDSISNDAADAIQLESDAADALLTAERTMAGISTKATRIAGNTRNVRNKKRMRNPPVRNDVVTSSCKDVHQPSLHCRTLTMRTVYSVRLTYETPKK